MSETQGWNGPVPEVADFQASEDLGVLAAMVRFRRESGLTITEVAERIGEPRERVVQFEADEMDPPMSFLRRYSIAIGARVVHEIIAMPDTVDDIKP